MGHGGAKLYYAEGKSAVGEFNDALCLLVLTAVQV